MLSPVANPSAVAVTFEASQEIIKTTCRIFSAKYNVHLDECLSKANEAFLVAEQEYKPERGTWNTFLRWVLWKGLLDDLRTNIKKHSATQGLESDQCPVHDQEPSDIDSLAEGLSPDAEFVLRLILQAGGLLDARTTNDKDVCGCDKVTCEDCCWEPISENELDSIGIGYSDKSNEMEAANAKAVRGNLRRFLNSKGWNRERVSAAYEELGNIER